jgi:hypothetical protein
LCRVLVLSLRLHRLLIWQLLFRSRWQLRLLHPLHGERLHPRYMALLVAGAGVCPVQQPLLEVLGLTAGADAVAICASAGQMMMGADDAQIAAAVEAVMRQWFRVYVVCASLLHAGLGAPLKISTVLPGAGGCM